jgi:hypothetical protein
LIGAVCSTGGNMQKVVSDGDGSAAAELVPDGIPTNIAGAVSALPGCDGLAFGQTTGSNGRRISGGGAGVI